MKRTVIFLLTFAFCLSNSAWARASLVSRSKAEKATTEESIRANLKIEQDGTKNVFRTPALGIMRKPDLFREMLQPGEPLVKAVESYEVSFALNTLFYKIDEAAANFGLDPVSLMEGTSLSIINENSVPQIHILVPADDRFESYFYLDISINVVSGSVIVEEGLSDHP